MALEDQGLNAEENKQALSEMVDDLIDELPSNLWSQP